jgi:hypothetical protein
LNSRPQHDRNGEPLNPLDQYDPEAFVEDVELMLMAVAYDVRMAVVKAVAFNAVRSARSGWA